MNIVTKNLLKLMKEKDIIDSQLCKECDINHSALYDWKNEKSSPSQKTLKKICEYFNVPLSYFYQEHQEIGNKSEIQELFDSLSPADKDFLLNEARELLKIN